jgi:hypothetical protein
MKLIVVVVVILAAVAGLGFYQGWFHVGSQDNGGTADITLTVDKDKMGADGQKAKDTVQDLGRKTEEKVAEGVEKAK